MDEDRDLTTAQLLSMGFDLDAITTAYTLSEDSSLESLLSLLTSSLFTPPSDQPPSMQPAKKLPPPQQKSSYPSYIYSPSFPTPALNSKHSDSSSNEWEDEEDEYNLEEDMAVDILDMEHIVLVKPDRDKIYELDEVIQEIYNELQEVSETLGVSLGHAALIMKNNQWNREKVMEKFFKNPESIMVYAPYQRGSYDAGSSENFTCPICLTSDIPKHSVFTLECRHAFCVECWRMYIEELINRGDSESLRCMETSCSEVLLDTDFIKRIVAESEFKKYLKFWVNKFIDSHPLWTFCPQPGCEYLFKSDGSSLLRCFCGYTFCSKCHKEAHYPATCIEMEKWDEKCKSDSETYKWLKVNTKTCPKCKTSIEKNGGCNHMTCKKCSYEFCWICFGDWNKHGNCNAYNPDSEEAKKLEMTRMFLERYLHYYHRYINHENSKKLESELRDKSLNQMMSMNMNPELSSRNVKIVDEATENLIECRRVLKYTYVAAFYMKKGPNLRLFEYLQGELERSTEELSHLLEAEAAEIILDQIRAKSNAAATRLIKMLEGIDTSFVNNVDQRSAAGKELIKYQLA
jgi:ariadne-1